MAKTLSEEIYDRGRESYPVYSNPYVEDTARYRQWARGWWDAHDESYDDADTGGFEEGYGDYLDMDAVSQGFYDDDPSPYGGTYSEM